MARIPDGFDLWVRKARKSTDPARQIDLVLGALVARPELSFLNVGTKEAPSISRAAIATNKYALIFTDEGRVGEFVAEHTGLGGELEAPVIISPTAAALRWCVENGVGLLINPEQGETVMVPCAVVAKFEEEWRARSAQQASGFWIPNMTTAEEDFWQEHGL